MRELDDITGAIEDAAVRIHRDLAPGELTTGCHGGLTNGMKTAISVPDRIFRAAERHAHRAKKSRSQLYAEALAEYLARHAPEEVTEAMNRVVDDIETRTDPFLANAARQTFARSEW